MKIMKADFIKQMISSAVTNVLETYPVVDTYTIY